MTKLNRQLATDFVIGYILYVVFISVLIQTSYGSSTNEFPIYAFNTNNMASTPTNLIEVGKLSKETINELNDIALSSYRMGGTVSVEPIIKNRMKK